MSAIRLSGPADVVAAVPRLCGFTPADSLVALVLGERHLLVTSRCDLRAADDDLDGLLAHYAAVDGGERVVWVLYEPALLARPELAQRLAGWSGLRVEDVISVADGRWADYLCQQACCPPGGTPIADAGEVVAELVARGMTAAASREERAALIEFDGPPDRVHEAMADALQDVEVRDGLLRSGAHGLLDDLCAIMRGLPDGDPRLPRVAGATAAVAYLSGDGALANLALDRAGSDSLAYLVATAIRLALPPRVMRESFAAGVTR